MLTEKLKQAYFSNQDNDTPAFSPEIKALSGFSGVKFMKTLQSLAKLFVDEEKSYVEVGVFQGLTLMAVASEIPDFEAVGIDNFAFFDKEKRNQKIIEERRSKLKLENVKLVNMDYEDAFLDFANITDKKIGLYLVDGPHDYRSQMMCLLYAKPFLADESVIVIDDCNYKHVRQANRDFLISHPEYKLVFESYTEAHPNNQSANVVQQSREGWWNGINVIARDPNNVLSTMYPPVEQDKSLFVNDHTMHSIRYPEYVTKFIPIINTISSFMNSKWKPKNEFIGDFDKLNTHSKGLKERLNNALD
ncbi:MAG: class I SAM-dependent methyltransferase [Bacteroidia bacterium]|jgi:hypothetical protein|nr:class I SAM-dependent methyltransferase [Bacteroidia bacterium]